MPRQKGGVWRAIWHYVPRLAAGFALGFFPVGASPMTLQPAIEKLAREITQLTFAGEPGQPAYGRVKLSQTNVPVIVESLVPNARPPSETISNVQLAS